MSDTLFFLPLTSRFSCREGVNSEAISETISEAIRNPPVTRSGRRDPRRARFLPPARAILLVTLCLVLSLVVRSSSLSLSAQEFQFAYPLIDAELSQWVVTGCEVEFLPGAAETSGDEDADKDNDNIGADNRERSVDESPGLKLVAGNGFVRSAHRYRDFELQLQWRPLQAENWDSGIYFRCEAPEGDSPWPEKYQINLKEGEAGRLLGAGVSDLRAAGAVKPGQWNHFRLRVIGNQAELAINGEIAWIADQIEPLDGFIGLQVEVPAGGQFEFRDIQITELGLRSMFNGQDLTGWEGATQDASSCWKVEEGLLICTGEKGTWLRSRDEFDDFNLRFEYRLRTGGNSGIYVRVPEDGNHHGDGAGVEIQLLDDHAERYRELMPYQYCGSIYAIVPASPRVCRPAGKWNVMEIDCRGTSYHVMHNGVEVISADADEYPELAGRLLQGYLGLQNHSEEVWFRNLRIGPSQRVIP